MSIFDWICSDRSPTLDKYIKDGFKAEPELAEPKGLEIITITPPLKIEVKYNGGLIGTISERGGSYKFIFLRSVSIYDPTYNLYLDSSLLKTIASKLDELNGVDSDRSKLEDELQMLLVSNSFGMSSSDIMANKNRIKEIRNILNNP